MKTPADQGPTDEPRELTKPCPGCDGGGFVIVHALVQRDGRREGEWRRHDCTLCGATGEIDAGTERRLQAGRALKEARIARLETQAQVAERLGISVAAYSRLEAGRP